MLYNIILFVCEKYASQTVDSYVFKHYLLNLLLYYLYCGCCCRFLYNSLIFCFYRVVILLAVFGKSGGSENLFVFSGFVHSTFNISA